jgi:hypothetical protein
MELSNNQKQEHQKAPSRGLFELHFFRTSTGTCTLVRLHMLSQLISILRFETTLWAFVCHVFCVGLTPLLPEKRPTINYAKCPI